MKPVHRCSCGCMLSVQRIKYVDRIIVRFVCFRCYKTRRKFFMRGTGITKVTVMKGNSNE